MEEPGLSVGSSDPKVPVYSIMVRHLSALPEIVKVPLLRTHHTDSAKQSLLQPRYLNDEVQSTQKRERISERNPCMEEPDL